MKIATCKFNHANWMRVSRGVRVSLLIMCTLCLAPFVKGQILEIKARASVVGARVVLEDLVRPGVTLPEGWGERDIADAPPPQEMRTLSLSEIAEALKPYEDMSRVVLRGRQVVELTSESQPVQVELVQHAVNEYVLNRAGWEDRRFEVDTARIKSFHVPKGALKVEVHSLKQDPEKEAFVADIGVRVAGSEKEEVSMRVSLQELRPFWAVNRHMARGDMVSAGHLEKKWIPEGDASRYYPVDNVVEGKELRRNLQAGDLIAQGMLREPMYVRRGEVVRVVFESGSLNVTLRARALADGRRGDNILCVNESSGQRMYVRIVRPREAVLDNENGGMES